MDTPALDKPGSKLNPLTVSDSTPPAGLNPADQEPKDDSQETINKPWPGSSDAKTVNGIGAVTAVSAGPNVLVSTNSSGKMPLSVMPGVSGSFVSGGQTFTITNGLIVSIV